MSGPPSLARPLAATLQLCTFWLEGRRFGVDILDVKEVSDDVELTPIAHAPPSVLGYLGVRGQLHVVMDLRYAFRFERTARAPRPAVVLFRSTVDEPFGVIADRLDDVVTIGVDQIEERRKRPPELLAVDRRRAMGELSLGVCRLERGLLVVLNARGILPALTGGNARTPSAAEEKRAC